MAHEEMQDSRVVPEIGEAVDAAPRTTVTRVSARPTIRVALPDGWARAALSGIEAAFIGWALTLLVTLTGFAAISGNSWMKSVTWEQAFAMGSDLWGAFLGARLLESGVAYSATPLLVPLLLIALTRLLLTSGRSFPQASQWMVVPFFALTSVALTAWGGQRAQWWTALPLALLIPLCAAAWAVLRYTSELPAWMALPSWAHVGRRIGLWCTGAVAALGAVSLGVSLILSWERVQGIHALLMPASLIDHTLIIGAQVLFAPNAIMWAISWLAGSGFYLGADALHTPSSAVTAPIPAVPLFAAVPTTAPGQWIVLILVTCGVLFGVILSRWYGQERLRDHLAAAGLAAALLPLAYTGCALYAGLSLGDGRLSVMGPRVAWTAFLLLVEVGGGLVLTALALHPDTRAFVKTQWELSKKKPGDQGTPSVPFVDPQDEAAAPEGGILSAERAPRAGDEADGSEVEEAPLGSADDESFEEQPVNDEEVAPRGESDPREDAAAHEDRLPRERSPHAERAEEGEDDSLASDVQTRVNGVRVVDEHLSEMPTERLDLSSER